MQEYRLYFLSAAGHFVRAVEMVCADDGEAVERAEAMRQGAPAELWQLGRAVQSFAAVQANEDRPYTPLMSAKAGTQI